MLPANVMYQFGIFPSLSLQLKNFDKFVKRFFELACCYVQEERDLLLSSQLLTYVNILFYSFSGHVLNLKLLKNEKNG